MTNTNIHTRLRSLYGFKTAPFSKQIDPERIFRTESFTRALDQLRYLLDRRGIGAIFGAPGTGKSTAIRAFLASLAKTSYSVCYVAHTNCASLDLYRQIARGFQLDPGFRKADVLQEIKDQISKLSRTNKIRPLLIIDEAHLLPAPSLDDIRLLTSFEADSADHLTLVLSGHPQLESNLRLAVNEALAQRIIMRIRLRSLHPHEVEQYLAFRLEIAGRTAPLFLPDAIEAIAKAARGVPRLIDSVAEHSLLLALATNAKEIDSEIVTDAIDEALP